MQNAAGQTERERDSARERDRVVAQPMRAVERPVEVGGRPGPEPTRFGDWEKNGRCIDF